MALIKYGPVVADARGSVGGTVFTRNRFGAVMKQRTTPKYNGSERQAAMTALMSVIVDSWNTDLTVALRNAFNSATLLFTVPNALGEQVHLTGMQWYMRCNFLLSLTGQTLVTAPPVAPIIPAPTLTIEHVPDTGIVCSAIGDWDTSATTKVLVSTSATLRQTVNYFKGPWPSRVSHDATQYDSLPFNIRGSAILVINSRYFLRFRSVHSDGASSFAVIYSADVGAVA